MHVIAVAWIALAILIAALLAAAIRFAVFAVGDANDILFASFAELPADRARYTYAFVRERSRNVAIAFALSVIAGPFGAYLYLGEYGKAILALVTLNGLGAWWIESWFSIPQVVLMRNCRLVLDARASLEGAVTA